MRYPELCCDKYNCSIQIRLTKSRHRPTDKNLQMPNVPFLQSILLPFSTFKLSPIRTLPAAAIPPENTNNKLEIQKCVIDCPICSHEPVSVTLKKNVMVITATPNQTE